MLPATVLEIKKNRVLRKAFPHPLFHIRTRPDTLIFEGVTQLPPAGRGSKWSALTRAEQDKACRTENKAADQSIIILLEWTLSILSI